jgi:plastocyanin
MKRVRLIAGALVLLGCGGGGGDGGGNPTGPTGPSGPSGSSSASVQIQGSTDIYGDASFSFNPSTVTIVRNGTVTWSNDSGETHNVTFSGQAGSPSNVPDFGSGSVVRTFGTAGAFTYTCTLHPGMAGQVTVQ